MNANAHAPLVEQGSAVETRRRDARDEPRPTQRNDKYLCVIEVDHQDQADVLDVTFPKKPV